MTSICTHTLTVPSCKLECAFLCLDVSLSYSLPWLYTLTSFVLVYVCRRFWVVSSLNSPQQWNKQRTASLMLLLRSTGVWAWTCFPHRPNLIMFSILETSPNVCRVRETHKNKGTHQQTLQTRTSQKLKCSKKSKFMPKVVFYPEHLLCLNTLKRFFCYRALKWPIKSLFCNLMASGGQLKCFAMVYGCSRWGSVGGLSLCGYCLRKLNLKGTTIIWCFICV